MSNNNIEKDIKIVEQCIVESISVPLDLDNIDVNNYRKALLNVVNELKRIRSLGINRLVKDYETGQLIDANKVRKLIKDKEIYLPMANTTVDEYTEAEVICREIKSLKELLKEE